MHRNFFDKKFSTGELFGKDLPIGKNSWQLINSLHLARVAG